MPRSSAHRRTCSSDRKRSIVDQVAPMSSHHFGRPGPRSGARRRRVLGAAPSRTSSRIGSAQSGHERVDPRVRVQARRDPQGVPDAVGEVVPVADRDLERCRDRRERCRHPDRRGPGLQDEGVGVCEPVQRGFHVRGRDVELGRELLRARWASVLDQRSVDGEPEVPIERVGRHGLTIRRRPSLDEGPEWPAVTPIASRSPTAALRPRSLAWKAHRQVRSGRNPAGSSRRLSARLGRCGSKRSPSRG